MTHFSNHILQRVASFMPLSEGTIFVALSGGPDSVALLHILLSLGHRCMALHCNFHLRDAESDRDELFCRQLCQGLNVPLEVRHFDTRAYMLEHHLSLEMAARELRYQWWQEKTASPNSEEAPLLIALGHHGDDSIETLLMNLLRGTGIHGLTGIVAHNEATNVVRPLLCLSRQEILDYLTDNRLSYVTDSTNAHNDNLRNQIRNQLLPLMQQLVPHCRQGISQTIQHLQSTEAFAGNYLRQFEHLTLHFNQWGIEWQELPLAPVQAQFGPLTEDYLFEWERRHCNPVTHRLCRDAHRLYTVPKDDQELFTHRPNLTSQLTTSNTKTSILNSESFDAQCVKLPLTLRRYRRGDRMAPLGMNGHTKLISDLFQAAHYSPMQKATTWLVEDATGAIIWAIGLRISDLHKVTHKTTQQLILTAQ